MRKFLESRICIPLFAVLLTDSALAQDPYTEDLKTNTPKAETEIAGATDTGARELSIQEAIERAMSRSPLVDQARAERDIQREAKRGVYTYLGPSVNVRYTQTYFDDKQTQESNGNSILLRDDVTKTGSLIVSQTLTGLYAATQVARLNSYKEEAAEEGLKSTRAGAGFLGATAFLRAYETQEQVLIAEVSVSAAKSAFNDAQVLGRVGRLNQADLLKFQLALSQSETRLAQARANKVVAFANLAQTLRLEPNDRFALKQGLPEVKDIPTDVEFDKALAARPDLKQASLNVDIADFGKSVAYAQFIPNVSAFVQRDRNFGEPTAFSPDKDTQYYGVSLNWEVWSSGRSIFAVREASAQRARAEAGLANARDNVRLDILQSSENYKAAKEALKQAEAGVAQADEAYRIDKLRFKSGSISATDLILSESMRTDASGRSVSARTNYLGWYFRLQQSLGAEQPTL